MTKSMFRSVGVVLLACILAMAGVSVGRPAMAQPSSSEIEVAREQFRLGNEAYQSGRWREAIEYFENANRIAPNARLLLYIGQCYLQLDNPARALEYVRLYADSSPQAFIEVEELLQGLEQTTDLALERARRAVDHAWGLARPGGRPDAGAPMSDLRVVPIQIRSTPPGANVFISDESLGPVGRTPLDTELFVGHHHIIIRLDNYDPHVERINITPLYGASPPVVNANLRRMEAQVDISVNPPMAQMTYISSAGQAISLGRGSYQGTLPAGSGVFLVQHAGSERRIERVVRGGSEPDVFTLNLNPADDTRRTEVRLGTLVLRSNLPFARITVDGAFVGEGIGEFPTDLRPGIHTIRVSQEGYETLVDNITIAEGERQTWNAPTRLVEISTVPWGGIITGSLGVAALVTGAVFGSSAASNADDFNACQLDLACGYAQADDYRSSAKLEALIADVSLVVGGALAVTSLVLFLTQGPSQPASASADSSLRFGAIPLPDRGWVFTIGFDNSLYQAGDR